MDERQLGEGEMHKYRALQKLQIKGAIKIDLSYAMVSNDVFPMDEWVTFMVIRFPKFLQDVSKIFSGATPSYICDQKFEL